jgi:hypothetical protein
MEIPRCEEQHTRAPLRIRRRTIKNSPDNSPSEKVKGVLTELRGG